MKRGIILIVLTICTGLAASMVTIADAKFAVEPELIRPVSSGRAGSPMCLDIPYSSYSNGQALAQWGCTGNANQKWQMVWVYPYNRYAIRSMMNNKCVDVPYGSNQWGQVLTQYDCHYGSNQLFSPVDMADGRTQYMTSNGLCLQIAGQGAGWGASLVQWGCYDYNENTFASKASPSFGFLDGVTLADPFIKFEGWAAAASEPTVSIDMQLTLSSGSTFGYKNANKFRSDVGSKFTGYGDFHGFSFVEDIPIGASQYCISAWSYGISTPISCGDLRMFGELEFTGKSRNVRPANIVEDGQLGNPHKPALDAIIDGLAAANPARSILQYKASAAVKCPLVGFVRNNIASGTNKCAWGLANPNYNSVSYAHEGFVFEVTGRSIVLNPRIFTDQPRLAQQRALVAHELAHLLTPQNPGAQYSSGLAADELNADCLARTLSSNSDFPTSYVYLAKFKAQTGSDYLCPVL